MSFLIKKLIIKAAEKVAKTNPSEIMTQINADETLTILKELLL